MDNPVVLAILAWFFPGAGHLVQKRYLRGLLIGGSIWLMFIIAIASGGAYYPGFDYKDGQLLYLLNLFSRLGNGLGAALSFLFSVQPAPNIAALASFEYGGRFLETAGLLNYLAAMDAVDVSLGRKK